MKYPPVGVDIVKHLMQVHFIDERIGEVIDRQIKRAALWAYFSPTGMVACGGSQHRAR